MTALLLGAIGKLWPYIVGAIGLVVAAMKLRQSGANAERARQTAAEAKARDIADQVDNDVGAVPPAEARAELKRW
jgi:hypothetical protein